MGQQKTTFFSIIIPCLNEESFLPLLLNCLKNQAFRNFEVIVVDANSDDKTQLVAKQFPDYSLLVSKKRNIPYQCNLGASRAHGTYILILEADVQIGADFLARLHDQLTKQPCDVFSTYALSNSSRLLNRIVISLFNVFIACSAKVHRPLFSGTCMGFRRDVFEKLSGFNETLYLSQDHEIVKRFVENGYSYTFYSQPKYLLSMRRFEKNGFVKTLALWFVAAMADIKTKGGEKTRKYYPLGGTQYDTHHAKHAKK